MNCKELTVGSLVRDIDSKEIAEVESLFENRMYTNIKYYLDDIEGIPLNTDWLEKKFKRKKKGFINESHYVLFNGLVYILDYGFVTLNGKILFNEIKYVHQLQSLYILFNKKCALDKK